MILLFDLIRGACAFYLIVFAFLLIATLHPVFEPSYYERRRDRHVLRFARGLVVGFSILTLTLALGMAMRGTA